MRSALGIRRSINMMDGERLGSERELLATDYNGGKPIMKNVIQWKPFALMVATALVCFALQAAGDPDSARWEKQARNVTIIRDDWGIAHVYGKTDADAVFGMDLRPGRGRLQSRRDELHQRDGPAGGGRRRVQNLSGSADEAVHRSGGVEERSTRRARRG